MAIFDVLDAWKKGLLQHAGIPGILGASVSVGGL
jgi:hypothetical protein